MSEERKPSPLMAFATPRRQELKIHGVPLVIVEPGATLYGDYKTALREDGREAALAMLMFNCVQNPDGSKHFTLEEALTVAGGRGEVFSPIVISLLQWVAAEKKGLAKTPAADSSTDSPGTSGKQ